MSSLLHVRRPPRRSGLRRSRVLGLVLLVVGLATPPLAAPALAAPDQRGHAAFKVMTRNVYQGAELTPIFAVTTPQQLVAAVTTVFARVQATNFPERAEALADEIADTDPQLVGLQEVALWRSQTPADFNPVPNATHVEFDFLDLLLDALADRGRHYSAVTVVTNFDAEAPRVAPTGLQDIRLTDRGVILARTDLPTKVFSVANAQSANFATNVAFPHPLLGTIVVRRGWTAVDATVGVRTVRVVNTHLERTAPAVQVAQGNELLAGPANTTLPVVLLGDLNSAAGAGGVPGQSDTPTYDNMLAAGFTDTWTATRGDQPGFTCCHAENLSNPTPTLTERIDLILVRGDVKAATTARVGHQPGDRTPSGLWPSDHAGVRAVLHVGGPGRSPGG